MCGAMILRFREPGAQGRWVKGSRMAVASAGVLWLALGIAGGGRADVWINEFVADNEGGLRTQAGVAADWIELANDGLDPVDLSGWHLTDRADAPTKWRIPHGTIIPAGGYLVVFADSSEHSIPNSELHANFSLSAEGE